MCTCPAAPADPIVALPGLREYMHTTEVVVVVRVVLLEDATVVVGGGASVPRSLSVVNYSAFPGHVRINGPAVHCRICFVSCPENWRSAVQLWVSAVRLPVNVPPSRVPAN